jgi:ribosomal protein L35
MTIFIDNKYTRWYHSIIKQRAIKDRRRKGEVHHIIPESFYKNRTRSGPAGWLDGDPDSPDNLVKLNGHDHAWCHWLLTKMVERDTSAYHLMSLAFNMMGVYGDHMDRPKSYAIVRAYERNRAEAMKALSITLKKQYENGREVWNKGQKLDPEKYGKGGRKNKGRVHTAEENEAKRLRQLGKKQSVETSEKKRVAMTGFIRGPMSDDEKLKRSIATTGVPKNHGAKVAAANVGVVSINKNGEEKKVKRELLDTWLNDGWALGGRPRGTQQGKKRGPYKKKLEA